MQLGERVIFAVGVFIALFGFIMITGALAMWTDPEPSRSSGEIFTLMLFLGVAPLAGGVLLSMRMRRKGSERLLEQQERELLKIAAATGGELTVADVSMKMTISSKNAKELLDNCHLNGLADINVSETGQVIYRFHVK